MRREHVHLVGEQVDLDALEELLGVAALLHLDQVRQPLARALAAARVAGVVAGLVVPVRGDAGLGDAVHVLGADLHFDRHAVRAEQRRVQRLVAVDARDRDVVLEAARHRLEHRVHDAERAVAGVGACRRRCASRTRRRSRASERALAPHLLVDAVEVLLARLDPRLDAGLLERAAAAARRSCRRTASGCRARASARARAPGSAAGTAPGSRGPRAPSLIV